jgi:hypothetical protein
MDLLSYLSSMIHSVSEARGAAVSVFQIIDEVSSDELTSNIDSNVLYVFT